MSNDRFEEKEMWGHGPEWRVLGLILIVSCLAVLALFQQTAGSLVAEWARSRTYAHGFLVVPASLYLIWCYRDRFARLVPRPSRVGLMLLGVIGAGWLIGRVTNRLLVEQIAITAMFPGLVWATLGTVIFRVLLFPLGFLVFALPIGTSVEPWFQEFTAAFIVMGFKLTGIPVLWEGNLIDIPSGTWEVARDCGGLRYVLPGVALGYLFATIMYRGMWRRVGFLLLCAVLLILANGVRAYGIVAGDHLGIAEGTDHRVFSYTVYAVTVGFLFWIGRKWKEPEEHAPHGASVGDGKAVSSIRQTALTALGAVLLLALAQLSAWLWNGGH